MMGIISFVVAKGQGEGPDEFRVDIVRVGGKHETFHRSEISGRLCLVRQRAKVETTLFRHFTTEIDGQPA